jgi:hypothetical protein
MDTRTGKLITSEDFEIIKQSDPLAANWYKLIPDDFLPEIAGMNRKERRMWYKLNKKRIKEVNNNR